MRVRFAPYKTAPTPDCLRVFATNAVYAVYAIRGQSLHRTNNNHIRKTCKPQSLHLRRNLRPMCPWRCPSLRRSSSRRPRQLVELVLSWYILLARPLSRREGGTCLLWTSGSQSAAGTHRSIEVLTANKSTWTCSTSAPTSLVGCLVQLGVVRSRQTARQELQVRAEPPHPPSPHSLIDPGGTGCPP